MLSVTFFRSPLSIIPLQPQSPASPLINLITSDFPRRPQIVIPPTRPITQSLAMSIFIQFEGFGVVVKLGRRVEVGAIDIDGWREGDGVALNVFSAMESSMTAVVAVDIKFPSRCKSGGCEEGEGREFESHFR